MVAINPNIFQSQISALLSICQHVVAQLVLRKKKKQPKKPHLPIQEVQELWV